MKLETIEAPSCQDRLLVLFDVNSPDSRDDEVRSYLTSNGLEAKRQYKETRGDTEYEVLYFGYCYIGKHLDSLNGMAAGD